MLPVTKEGCVAAVPFVARNSCFFMFITRLSMDAWPGGGGQYAASRYPVPSTGVVHGGSSNVLMLVAPFCKYALAPLFSVKEELDVRQHRVAKSSSPSGISLNI